MKLSLNKEIYLKLSDVNKKKFVDVIQVSTGRSKLTIKQHWIYSDNFPVEHQKIVKTTALNLYRKQQRDEERELKRIEKLITDDRS